MYATGVTSATLMCQGTYMDQAGIWLKVFKNGPSKTLFKLVLGINCDFNLSDKVLNYSLSYPKTC